MRSITKIFIFFLIPQLIGCQTTFKDPFAERTAKNIEKYHTVYIHNSCGCENIKPTQQEIDNAHYGAEITLEDAKKQVNDFFIKNLKDPYSAKLKWSNKLLKSWMRDVPSNNCKIYFGYILFLTVNAKNGFGAYTGDETHMFFLLNGSIISMDQVSSEGHPVFYGFEKSDLEYKKC